MSTAKPVGVANRLIEGLPRKVRDRFLKRCELVELTFGDILCAPGEPYVNVYFPLTGFISVVAPVESHPPLEMRLIGNEGLLGATLALGVDAAPLAAVVQGTGMALRMSARQLRRELRGSALLRSLLKRYLYVLIAQLSQSVACNRFHETAPRLARWLLMTHDRAHADHFHLTHTFLADMLGVQRSAVTIAAGALQRRKLIHYTRGKINVLHRKGLEAASCECYQAANEDYAQLFA